MAFDFNAAAVPMARKQPKKPKKQTFEDALEQATTKLFDSQITLHQTKNHYDKNGTQKPSNWMRKDEDGNWFISYRIKGKPIHFNAAIAEENGFFKSTDVENDLNAIREEIVAGKWDKEAREAFERPSAKELKAIEKAEAEAEAEADG